MKKKIIKNLFTTTVRNAFHNKIENFTSNFDTMNDWCAQK